MFQTIELLAGKDGDKREVARLFDLWLNAERRAVQGRFDDAAARWYRLMEWTAQWLLGKILGISSTAKFPRKELPEGFVVAGTDEEIPVDSWKAWQVVKGRFDRDARGVEDSAREFIDGKESEFRDLLQKRNHSILAHGFEPVDQADWKRIKSFTEEHFLCVLRAAQREVGLKMEPRQLPAAPPDFLLTP